MGTKPRQTRCLPPSDPFLTFTTPATTTVTTTQDPHILIPSSGNDSCGRFYVPKGSHSIVEVNSSKVDLLHDKDIFVSQGNKLQTISDSLSTGSSIFPSKLSLQFSDGGIASQYTTNIYDNLTAKGQIILTVSSVHSDGNKIIGIKKLNSSESEKTVVGTRIDFVGGEIIGNHDVNNSKLILNVDSICDEVEQENICDSMGIMSVTKLKDPLCQGLLAPSVPYAFSINPTRGSQFRYNDNSPFAGHPSFIDSIFTNPTVQYHWNGYPNPNPSDPVYQQCMSRYEYYGYVTSYDQNTSIMPKITRYELHASKNNFTWTLLRNYYDESFLTRGIGYHSKRLWFYQQDFFDSGLEQKQSQAFRYPTYYINKGYYFKVLAINPIGVSISSIRYHNIRFK